MTSATNDEVELKRDRKPRGRRYAVPDVVEGDSVEMACRGLESVRVTGIDAQTSTRAR